MHAHRGDDLVEGDAGAFEPPSPTVMTGADDDDLRDAVVERGAVEEERPCSQAGDPWDPEPQAREPVQGSRPSTVG